MCCIAKNRSKAIKSIKKLRDTGWMTPFTQIVMVQFILYNGPSNLFTAVTILVEQTSTGALIPSASIQSTRLYHFPAVLDYSVMTCEVSILLQSIRMYLHVWQHSSWADKIKGIVKPNYSPSCYYKPVCFFHLLNTNKDKLINVGNQTVDVAIDFHSIIFKIFISIYLHMFKCIIL